MAKKQVVQGATSQLAHIFVPNSSVTTGAGLTGLVYNTSGLIAYYLRDGDASATAITLATATLGTWATGGFIVVDGTHMPGLYEVGLPNAVFANLGSVVVYLSGAANMAPVILEYEITATNNQSATAFMTSAGVSGDFSATMKTSLNAATPASVQNIVAQTGDVGALITTVGAAGVGLTAVALSAAGNNAITAALAALAVSVAPTAGTWGEAIAFALAGIGKAKVTYAPPSGINTNDGVLTVYAKDGTTVLKTFSAVNVDASGNTTVRV